MKQTQQRAQASDIKSARRVLEVFELFSRLKRPASVSEIQRELGYPQSSTSVLLQSLDSLGYLAHDRINRVYMPTIRVHLMGAWLQTEPMGGINLDESLRQLGRETGETVVLAVQNDVYVQYIQIHHSPAPMRLHIDPGILRPLCHTAAGKMLMTLKSERETRGLVGRVNALGGEEWIDMRKFQVEIDRCRTRRYALNVGSGMVGVGAIAILLPPLDNQPQMAVSVVGVAEQIDRRRRELLDILNKFVDELSVRLQHHER